MKRKIKTHDERSKQSKATANDLTVNHMWYFKVKRIMGLRQWCTLKET